jgi:hypothetical protein
MKCCNSLRNAETQTFNAQGSRVIVVVEVGVVKIYVAAVEWRRSPKWKDKMKLILPPNLMVF